MNIHRTFYGKIFFKWIVHQVFEMEGVHPLEKINLRFPCGLMFVQDVNKQNHPLTTINITFNIQVRT